MSNSALAYSTPHIAAYHVRSRLHRRARKPETLLPKLSLASIAVADLGAASNRLIAIKRPSGRVLGFAVLILGLHAAVTWYTSTHTHSTAVKQKHEVAVELVRPKPPEPKIEPPKPLPQKPQPVQKQAKVVPPIQTPAPSPEPAVVSDAPPVAVPPLITAAPIEAEPAPVTPPFGAAGYLNNPPPDYPSAAARAGWEGVVKLRVHVLSNGHVDVVEVQKSSGRKLLDDEAARTVKRWTFTPSKRGDTPVDGWANVPIEFKLEQ